MACSSNCVTTVICNKVIRSVERVKLLAIHILHKLSIFRFCVNDLPNTVMHWTAQLNSSIRNQRNVCLMPLFCRTLCMATLTGSFAQIKMQWKFKRLTEKPWELLQIINYTLSYADLLSTTKRCPLCVSRLKSMATETTHTQPSHFCWKFFIVSNTPYDLRGGKTTIQPSVETTTFVLKSFRYEGAKMWNNLLIFKIKFSVTMDWSLLSLRIMCFIWYWPAVRHAY